MKNTSAIGPLFTLERISGKDLISGIPHFGKDKPGGTAILNGSDYRIRAVTGHNVKGEESKRSIKRGYRVNDFTTGFPKGMRVSAGATLALTAAFEGFKLYNVYSGISEERSVNFQNNLIIKNVFRDISQALQKGGIISEENMNENDLSTIANVILFGGDATDDEKLIQAGLKIFDEISSKDGPISDQYNLGN